MTTVDRVRRTQRSLGVVVGSAVLLWAAAALFALLALGALLGAKLALTPAVRGTVPVIAAAGAVVTLAVLAWRGRFAWSFGHVALWIEERAPELRYVLVTAVDPRYRDTAGPLLDPIVARIDLGRFVRAAASRSLLPAAGALVVASAAFGLMPRTWKPALDLRGMLGGPRAPAVIGNRLIPLTGTLTPPAYAHLRSESLDEPSTITGLQGSRVTLTGRGAPDRDMRATLGDRDIPITAGGKGWMASFTMSDSMPAALKLVDRKYSRLIVVDPRVDEPPTARLTLPARDTTLRDLPPTLRLSADLSDDIGIETAQFEYIIARLGEGDAAEARTGTLGTRSFGGARQATFDLAVPYASLHLEEGDMLSVRAVVLDNNTLTGPGKGYSETRVIRLARKSEYDSLSINAAPPSADTAIVTLRMLIIATEKLDRQKPAMERKRFVDSSVVLGGKAEVVRQKIHHIIAEETGGGEIDASPLLTQAADAMWEATRSLYIAETGEAIPQLYIALKALQKYANERRYYMRGRLPPVVVNVERVRLTGADTGKAAPRAEARPREGAEKDRLRAQYTEALGYLRTQPARAIELFTLMRVATLRSEPALAAALGDAVTALQRATDATLPLLRARRALDGSAGAIDSLPVWGGAW